MCKLNKGRRHNQITAHCIEYCYRSFYLNSDGLPSILRVSRPIIAHKRGLINMSMLSERQKEELYVNKCGYQAMTVSFNR